MSSGADGLLVPLQPEGLAAGTGYSYGVEVRPGTRLVLLAGACPLDEERRTVAVGDVRGQARACLRNARRALSALDAPAVEIAFVRVLVATSDRSELVLAWDEVRRELGEVPGTLAGATVLGWPDQLVEVEIVAAVADGPGQDAAPQES